MNKHINKKAAKLLEDYKRFNKENRKKLIEVV